MSNWIIHIVGETIDDDLAPEINKFVKGIQALSHKVTQVRLTTDAGEKIIHVTQDAEDVTKDVATALDDVDPAVSPETTVATDVVDTVGADVDKLVADIEEKEEVKATETTPATTPVEADPTPATPNTTPYSTPSAIPTV